MATCLYKHLACQLARTEALAPTSGLWSWSWQHGLRRLDAAPASDVTGSVSWKKSDASLKSNNQALAREMYSCLHEIKVYKVHKEDREKDEVGR